MSIEQVAKFAGVSTATVSRVLNSVPVVSDATVQAVKSAMVALNYDPLEARPGPRPRIKRTPLKHAENHLRTRRISKIGLMTIGQHDIAQRVIRSPVINAVVESITQAAKLNGLQVMLDDVQSVDEVGKRISSREVDGVIVILAGCPADALAKLPPGIPVVWAMGGQAGPLPVDHISANNVAIGFLAHQYLQGRGCTDIGFLTANPTYQFAQHRRLSLASATSEAGHRVRSFVVSDDPILSEMYGPGTIARPTLKELIATFTALTNRPTGLFVDRDATTAQVYALLLSHGIHPGRDLSVVSCDNEDILLSSLYPRPATIELGIVEIGLQAVHRLLSRIANPHEPPVTVQAMPRLVPGGDDVPVQG